MAIVKNGPGAYAPADAVMLVVDGYRTKHPHTPFTPDNIQPLGVAPSISQRTIQALKLLDLLDASGEPTPAMDVLREAPSAEFPERLAEVVRAAYAEVFAYKNPATDSPEEMAELFRFYKPPSMQPRMIRLFYGLCARAGIIEAAPAIESSGKAANRKPPAQKKPQPVTDPPPTVAPPKGRLPRVIAALVEDLAERGDNVSAEDFAWFVDMVTLAGPRVYGFPPPEPES